ncbi:MAG: ribose-phosphate pyrophosphokinase [Deltaproteobacteria bacterium]|nr:ribose-phosphate pyrophosphokinase [Deltaproteobacteria bacterium]
MLDKIRIFSGNSNKALAWEICKNLGILIGEAEVKTFSDGEVSVDIKESVRGLEIYVVQSISAPCNTHLMELLLMLDALKRASAHSITAVIPYYGYSRQDRKIASRMPISAKLVADLVTVAGATRAVCVDLHAGQIQGFFNIPVDNIYAAPVLLAYIHANYNQRQNLVVVSPDAGGVERARAMAKRLEAGLAIIDKRRPAPNDSQVMNVIGEIEGKTVVLIDDIIDTAGTITQAAKALKESGAFDIYACCTHPVLSGPAIERIEASPIKELVVTNTIARRDDLGSDKIKYLSVGGLLAEAIKRIHYGKSLSSLFH